MKVLAFTLLVALASAIPLPEEEDAGVAELVVNGWPEGEPLDIGHIVDINLKEHSQGAVVASTNLLYDLSSDGIAAAAAAAAAQSEVEAVLVADSQDTVLVADSADNQVESGAELPAAVALPEIPTPEVVDQGEDTAIPEIVSPVDIDIPEAAALPEIPTPEVVEVPEGVALPEIPTPEVVELPEGAALPEIPTPEVVEETAVPEAVALPEVPTPEIVDSEVVSVAETAEEASAAQSINGEVYNDGLVSLTINVPEEPSVLETLQSWLSLVINYIQDGITATTQQIV